MPLENTDKHTLDAIASIIILVMGAIGLIYYFVKRRNK
jgi:hypothetical protein